MTPVIFRILIGVGLFGSIISMMQFSKYCGLLKNLWKLDEKTVERYQSRAQRWLAAACSMIVTAMAATLLSAILA